MLESIHSYFRIGLIAAMAFPDFGVDSVGVVREIARDPYFDAIELNPIQDSMQRQAAADLLRQSHMTVCCGAQARLLTTGLNPNSLDEDERKEAEQTLLEGVDEAARLGADRMAFLSGKWTQETRGQALEQLKKTTLAVCDYAETKGICVELEVFDFDIAKAALIGPASLAAQLASEIRMHCSNFGLTVDLSHMPMCYEKPSFVLGVLRPYITHFHIGNAVICDREAEAYGDEHPRFGFPGSENGAPQLLEFLLVLKNEGFFCKESPYVLSFEVKPRPYEDLRAVLTSSKRVLNRVWALLDD